MGAWDDSLNHDDRYALTEEWTTVIKRLWSEPAVDFDGRFFHMKDCVSDPKPISRPRPDLICAGMSERGFRSQCANQTPVSSVGGPRLSGETPAGGPRRSRQSSARTIKTYAMCTVIYDETDAKAEGLVKRYADGADMGAILEMLKSWGAPAEKLQSLRSAAGSVHDPDRRRLTGDLRRTSGKLSSQIASLMG